MSTWCDEGVIPFDAAEMPLRIGTPLYGLVPAGLGTAFQESLRGYLVRLAVEHNVKPRELVGRVLATIDPSIAALKRAEYAAILKRQCGWVPSRKGSCEAPSEEEMARFNAFAASDPVFGSRIVVR